MTGALDPTTVEDRLLSADEAAQLLGVSAYTVRQWARERRIPCVPLGPKLKRFRLASLDGGQVDDRDIARLIDSLIVRGRSPKTIRNVIGTLHSLFEIARRDRLIGQNPCDLAEVPAPRPNRDIHFLTPHEREGVLEAEPPADAAQAERDWWPVVRLLVLTASMTGMRLGELRALRLQDLDMAGVKVRVRQSYVLGQYGTPKSRRSARAIPLASRLVVELEEHHRTGVWNTDGDLVLAHPHTGRPLDRVRLLQHFKAALRRANVRPVRLHDLRHTFATTIAASGEVSLRTLQEWTGHLDARTTQIYADYMPGEREAELIDHAFKMAERTDVCRPFVDQFLKFVQIQTPRKPRKHGIPTHTNLPCTVRIPVAVLAKAPSSEAVA